MCVCVYVCMYVCFCRYVLTGTVLNGSVRVNDVVELPELKVQKKVKSMQVIYIYIYIYIYVCMYVCVYVCVCMYAFVGMYRRRSSPCR